MSIFLVEVARRHASELIGSGDLLKSRVVVATASVRWDDVVETLIIERKAETWLDEGLA